MRVNMGLTLPQSPVYMQGRGYCSSLLKCRAVITTRVTKVMLHLGLNLKTCHPTDHLCFSNAALFTALDNPQDCQGDFNYVINQSRSFYHVHTYAGIYVCMVLGTEPATFLY